jgi:hypothetical protein
MLSVLREMLEVEREPPEVEFATLSVLREQLSVFVGTPESLGERRTEWRGALRKLHVLLASITTPPM